MTETQPKLLIGGEFRRKGNGAPIPVVNPCTGETLWEQPACDADDVAEALAHARAAQKKWSTVHGWDRGRILRAVAAEMRARTDAIARALSLEIGRPIAQAAGEVGAAIEQFEWFAGEAERLFGDTIPSRQGGRLLTEPEPVGICAAFTAWNFPVNLPVRKIAPALAAGCAILVRPSEQVPLTSTLIAEACVAGGVPAGVVQLLLGRAEDISPAIMAADEVRKISLTGSTRVGQMLMAEAAKTMKRCSMELGGHSPVVVCADADVEAAATQCAAFKFRNAGQVCIAPNRFYVEESVADRFLAKMKAEAEALVLGDSQVAGTTMGPLTLASGRDKVERLIADAQDRGARLVTGGRRPEGRNAGFFLEPTVLADVPDEAAIMAEEPFGPVAPVATFRDMDDAIVRANSTPYGLAAYGFTGSHAKAEALSRGLHAGMVGVNTFMVAHAEAPFGGVDHSGTGREGGREAIRDYQNTKLTHMMAV
ncbi:NAD-dependent succinate-semialdehyde dehydrogenase [Roseibacterium sp. SDUM158017]|uniref:NAD-dependent succinate-semialdehyde dehydrogenase n=1 Tax=Roseicyclus salinarum TaxID=3036773 RepID=UPI00241559FA|nr:NAD-dependent succinate-semialdehyde dehydrogenase [Roseibacterium sp. SDUM158017]MDG4647896.1 NAD-dependent succinate-semialdehyde dehydrogenase [Roseibacterium sp. SDUM158017]